MGWLDDIISQKHKVVEEEREGGCLKSDIIRKRGIAAKSERRGP